MKRELNTIFIVALIVGFAITGIVLNRAFRVPDYLGRSLAISAGFVLTATLVQLLQTKRGYLDDGKFSFKRWSIQAVIICLLVTVIATIGDREARIKVMFVTLALLATAVAANKARANRLPRDQAVVQTAIICFCLIMAALPTTVSSMWLLILPIGLIAVLFLFMAIKRA